MWTVLGENTIYLDISNTFKKKLLALANDDETGNRYKRLLESTDVSFMINGETEENSFILKVPDELTPEDIQFMAEQTMEEIIRNDAAPVSVNNVEQKYKIIISNNKEPELIGLRKTPGMSSVEVFKPIFGSWTAPGKTNPNSSGGFQI